jgi:hypothetical protein
VEIVQVFSEKMQQRCRILRSKNATFFSTETAVERNFMVQLFTSLRTMNCVTIVNNYLGKSLSASV